ncbi:MAG: phosphoribosylglycinamide formyltransferase [Saprospiraceae bacterium]
MKERNIAIFASGAGTNADNIIRTFKDTNIKVSAIVSNNPNAGVVNIASSYDIPCIIVSNKLELYSDFLISTFAKLNIDLIVLAGFLRKIPKKMIDKYPKQIINIHPALLPKYGGKGMYGSIIHRLVKENGETKTGITIHYVNDKYDEGEVVFQSEFLIDVNDSVADIEKKIHAMEYKHFPEVISRLLID